MVRSDIEIRASASSTLFLFELVAMLSHEILASLKCLPFETSSAEILAPLFGLLE